MAVVVMQHAAGQAPTAVTRVLAAAGLASRTVSLAAAADPSADLSGIEGLIVLGGPRTAPSAPSGPSARSGRPASGAADPALVREALAAEVPVLALGTGTRLLAPTRGARAADPGTAADRPLLELTPAAGSDPLFAGAAPPSPGLRPALEATGWHLAAYEDGADHFLARAVPRG
ncbi:gamma-glutamyl-gamma-aminobutyrate hydrolase family protein [Streptomyces sp. NPDC058290]|uniref:gamma-glutamyl-gamma-aminobutyrate hydrolase family protein n=1 Tax=Streptomyces sp. NPDC058290 TaxID=3346426 RepID=UPI0036EBBFB1